MVAIPNIIPILWIKFFIIFLLLIILWFEENIPKQPTIMEKKTIECDFL